ncbi:DedA family protein [Pontibacillus salipaludis]|uniref:VTT domain-containing protein n=1 Tax=Pontibacillus salipaludis TaxID=1697394 RepID=A0ABQ1QF15_9BACI|nr:VTT domain-containing protein [Pontibacillus salipaludis]GGD24852.1 hypothetical protein GCM10011389_35690 [Pontibacillus salipaludis]
MLDFIVSTLKDWGLFGLLLSLSIEASSLPFPGGLVVLAYGYILKASALTSLGIALLAGGVYTLFSYIPYVIGYKLEGKLQNWFKSDKLEKAERWFSRCGEWTIALSRPLGLGNYVSYFSGISHVRPVRFGVITFIGITPYIYIMLLVGRMGNLSSIKNTITSLQQYVYLALACVLIMFLAYKIVQRKKSKSCNTSPFKKTSTKEEAH